MNIQIKNRFNGAVIFETGAESFGAAVSAAIAAKADLRFANLSYADLRFANLSYADLRFANLRSADLRSADLSYANLRSADLSYADLRSADLSSANLSYANLRSADLRSADLSYANLRSADLRSANLRSADLSSADLSSANLRSADLSSADLRYADLSSADLSKLLSARSILPDGDLIGWKKLKGGTICKLQIPANAARVGGLIGRKCRAEFAVVLDCEGVSSHNRATVYKVGETVRPDKYDPNPLVECSNGIHFFITRQEAEDYNL